MANKRHRDFPILDKDGRYLGMISRRNLLGAKGKRVVLVDHNEKNQAVAGIENAEIMEIIDHHRLGTIQTMSPVFFRNQPLGCTATIIYQMYQEAGVLSLIHISTGDTVTEIAVRCGFDNLSYFNRLFRRKYGMTPKEYRES